MDTDGIPLSTKDSNGGWTRILKRHLPILEWGARYDRMTAVADLVAGVTLGLTLVPQSIAYASLADLPVQYGLYSAYVGTLLYVLLGTVKEVSIGPTSLMALSTLQICRGLPIDYVVLLTFLSGCIVLLMGVLRLGFLVDLISPSVTSAFTSAMAVTIVVSQVKGLLGLSFVAESIADNVHYIALKWAEIRPADCVLGFVCCSVLLILRKLKDVRISPKRPRLKKVLWIISIGRNALVVLLSAILAYILHDSEKPFFKLSGRVEAGLPPLSLPPMSARVGNSTVGFTEMVQRLGSGLIMLPILMVLANSSIAKSFSSGGRLDATQEMVTLGLVNMAGALVHSMPTCGAFTRSAVSHSSGVRTPAAGLYSGIITLLALIFLTQYFYYIPKACLSSVLICAVMFMVDVGQVRRAWQKARGSWCVMMVTLVVGVVHSLELAVLAGALADLARLLRTLLRPALWLHTFKTSEGEVVRVRPTLCVNYLNAELVARRILAAASKVAPRPVLVDCGQISLVDYAAEQMFERLINKFKSSEQKLIFYNASVDVVHQLEQLNSIDRRALRVGSITEALALTLQDSGDGGETTSLLAKQDICDEQV